MGVTHTRPLCDLRGRLAAHSYPISVTQNTERYLAVDDQHDSYPAIAGTSTRGPWVARQLVRELGWY